MQIPIVMLHTAGGDFFLHFLCILCVFATKINVFQKEKTEKSENLKKSASGGATGPGFFLVSDLPPACLAMSAEHKLLYVRPNHSWSQGDRIEVLSTDNPYTHRYSVFLSVTGLKISSVPP